MGISGVLSAELSRSLALDLLILTDCLPCRTTSELCLVTSEELLPKMFDESIC